MKKSIVRFLLAVVMLCSLFLTGAGVVQAEEQPESKDNIQEEWQGPNDSDWNAVDFASEEACAEQYLQALDQDNNDSSDSEPSPLEGKIPLSEMIARAEAIVNYTWSPSANINTWAGSQYNGKTYFPAGQPVKGMPYTLFTYEVVAGSLCTLDRYKTLAGSNYSVTVYCESVGNTRTGPVYGSCCADLVCEAFGGSFLRGNRTVYHSVSGIKNSGFATTTYSVPMSQIQGGDALSNARGSHIIWIGEVTETTLTVYEQTPPVAIKVVVNKASATNSDGFFVYRGTVYSTVTRSKELAPRDPSTCLNHVAGGDNTVASAHPHLISYICVNCGTMFTRGETTALPNCPECQQNVLPPVNDHSCEEKSAYAVTIAPTMETAGVLTGTCSVCGDTTTIPLPSLESAAYSYAIEREPTCTAEGLGRYTWNTTTYGTFCFELPIARSSHSYQAVEIKPTCTEAGFTSQVCSACGDRQMVSEIPALGHRWDHGVVLQPPLSWIDGKIQYTCTVCGETKIDSIPFSSDCIFGTQCPGARFTDMPESDHWAHYGIDYVVAKGLFYGDTEVLFAPDINMSRAMIATVLWRQEGKPAGYQNYFLDVPEGEWFTDAIAWGAAEELVLGHGNRFFGPEDPVEREQIAVILYRYAQYLGQDVSAKADLSDFPDADQVSGWALSAMQWAVAEGVLIGDCQQNQIVLDPHGAATRAQVATILMRFFVTM